MLPYLPPPTPVNALMPQLVLEHSGKSDNQESLYWIDGLNAALNPDGSMGQGIPLPAARHQFSFSPPVPDMQLAQVIVPAGDGTNTSVTPVPMGTSQTRFEIQGGQLSGDGVNLFHSFEQFGLSAGQVADFLSNPRIQNILGRITGGTASVIDGLIQVTGGTSNLFLLNPAGIIFGPNSQLNVPAAFMATTANGIGFGNGAWFNALGANNWSSLVGTPQEFRFDGPSGPIFNGGNLTVGTGESLTLLGSTVINTGTLSAPGGTITIAAVPGQGLLRISQPGHLLSLEVENPCQASSGGCQGESNSATVSQESPLAALLSLPELLTGKGTRDVAAGVSVNSLGQVILTGSQTVIPSPPGTTLVSGTLDVSSPFATNAAVSIQGDRIGLWNARVNASGNDGGGTINIGGDSHGDAANQLRASRTYIDSNSVITADALNQGNGGRVIVWADDTTQFQGTITARGANYAPVFPASLSLLPSNGGFVEVSGQNHLIFQGKVDLSAANGSVGTLLLDPENINIVAADGANDAALSDGTILSGESPGAAATISQRTLEAITGNVLLEATNNITLAPGLSLTFEAGEGAIEFKADADRNASGSFIMDATQGIIAPGRNITISGANITVGEINTFSSSNTGGNITLTAANGNLTTSTLDASSDAGDGGFIALTATGEIRTRDVISFASSLGTGGNITFKSGDAINTNILFSSSGLSNGGAVALTAASNITTGDITASSLSNGQGGTITLEAGGDINTTAGTLDASSGANGSDSGQAISGNGGRISLTATGNINTASLNSQALAGGDGGVITLTSRNGLINTTAGTLSGSAASGNGGEIILAASGNINAASIESSSGSGTGGNIILNSRNGLIDTTLGSLNASSVQGAGGQIALTAAGDILTGNLVLGSEVGVSSLGLIVNTPSVADLTGGNITNNGAGITIGTEAQPSLMMLPPSLKASTINLFTSGNFTLENPKLSTNGGELMINSLGSITFSGMGFVQTGGGNLNLSGSEINAGNIAFDSSNLSNAGGQITLSASIGNIITNSLNSSGVTGGTIAATASNAITTGTIRSSGTTGNGGNISLLSGATLNTASLFANSEQGNGGIVRLEAMAVNAAGIDSSGGNSGGTITLFSTQGGITTNSLFATGVSGIGGNIRLNAAQDINIIGALNSSGGLNAGVITVFADGGTISINRLSADSTGNGDGGIVTLNAANGITTGDITTTSAAFNGGNLTLTSQNDAIRTGNLNTSGPTRGGNINIVARQQITTAEINTGSSQGDGGFVSLDPMGDVAVAAINTSGGGRGGNINIQTQQFFRATGTLADINGVNASVSSAGNRGGGTIRIQHGGGDTAPRTPFIVGDATSNGTANAITNGSNTITPRQVFPGPFTLDTIELITTPLPPDRSPSTPTPVITPPLSTGGILSPMPQDLGANATNRNSELSNNFAINQLRPILEGASPLQGLSVSTFIAENVLKSLPLENSDPISGLPSVDPLSPGLRVEIEYDATLVALTFSEIENKYTQETAQYFDLQLPSILTLDQAREILRRIEDQTGVRSALLYVQFEKSSTTKSGESPGESKPDPLFLQLLLVTGNTEPVRVNLPDITEEQVKATARDLAADVTNPRKRNQKAYLKHSQQFYQWLIQPIERNLQAAKIDNIVFLADSELRSLPFATLNNGQQFLLEKYSIGLMPSLTFTDSRYSSIANAEVLAMGASTFTELNPLPAVPVELSNITQQWEGNVFINEAFTLDNLKTERARFPFEIIHFATHAEFNPGEPNNSFIQFWGNSQLRLNQMRSLNWINPPVELLVLSACKTAIGNREAELGFGGLAVASGAKSALASLWSVSDQGTLALMTEFYWQLRHLPNSSPFPIKAEALRLAQLEMMRGNVKIESGHLVGSFGSIPLPPNLVDQEDILSQPYYWSAFSIIGSPW